MDAIDIKIRIKNNEKSDDLVCGKSLRWAIHDLDTFKFYHQKAAQSEDIYFILKKAEIKGCDEVVKFIDKSFADEIDYSPFYKTDKFYKISKTKYIEDFKKYIYSGKTFVSEEIGRLSLFCGMSGSLRLLEILSFEMPALRSDVIMPNALRGAMLANFPEVVIWVEKFYGKKITEMDLEALESYEKNL